MLAIPLILAVVLVSQTPSSDVSALQAELERLRGTVSALERKARDRDEALDGLKGDLKAVEAGITELRSRPVTPPSSDAVGVAKTVVFAPRIEADTLKRRDIVTLKVRRVDAARVQFIGERELGEEGVDLPIDQNGALYIVDWSTTEGPTYSLVLRDGTSSQAAATAQVGIRQTQGRFIFVGYRAE